MEKPSLIHTNGPDPIPIGLHSVAPPKPRMAAWWLANCCELLRSARLARRSRRQASHHTPVVSASRSRNGRTSGFRNFCHGFVNSLRFIFQRQIGLRRWIQREHRYSNC